MDVTLVLSVISVLIVLIFCIVYGKTAYRFFHLTQKIRRGPTFLELWLVHMKYMLTDDLITYLWKLTEDYEYKPWAFWFYWKYSVVISDAETLEEVFHNRDLVEKSKFYYDFVETYLGKTLITKRGTTYKMHRKIINPAFRKALIESNQLPHINKKAVNIVELLREEAKRGSVDVHIMIEERIGEACIAVLASGLCTYPNISELVRAVRATLNLVQLRTTNPVYYWLVFRWTEEARYAQCAVHPLKVYVKETFPELKQLVMEKMKESVNWEPSNAFECMLKGQMEVGEEEFSDEDIMNESNILVVGALEPTSYTMNLSMLALAIHPDIQERVFQEQESIFGQSHQAVEPKDLSRMIYLEMFIKETLRLFPLAPALLREVEKETCVNGMILPKGSQIVLNIMAAHRNPDYFKDALKFDPDRFLPENSLGRHPCAFVPFSAGTRTCVGQAQAMLFLKTMLSHVVRNVRILPGDGFRCIDDIKVKMCTFMTLQHFPPLRFITRNC